MELNRSSYYQYLHQSESEETKKLKAVIKEIFESSKSTYGRRRMKVAVNQRLNTQYNEKKINRLMIELDLQCVIRRKRNNYLKVKKDYIAENILNRDFSTTTENQKWSSDITEIPTAEGKLYLSAIIDVNSRKIISYEIANRNDNQLVYSTFKKTWNRNDVTLENLTIQTDRGFQYTSFGFKQLIEGIQHSMNRPGHCPDNSPIESFWGILKSESLYNPIEKEKFKSRLTAIEAITEYIEFYNNERITLKSVTPSQARCNALIQNI